VQILAALASNALEVFNVPLPTKSKDALEATRTFSLDLPGHRTDVRTLSLTSDDALLASASNGMWSASWPNATSTELSTRLLENMEHEDHLLYTDFGLWIRYMQRILARRSTCEAQDRLLSPPTLNSPCHRSQLQPKAARS
jgi:hypothetical protein